MKRHDLSGTPWDDEIAGLWLDISVGKPSRKAVKSFDRLEQLTRARLNRLDGFLEHGRNGQPLTCEERDHYQRIRDFDARNLQAIPWQRERMTLDVMIAEYNDPYHDGPDLEELCTRLGNAIVEESYKADEGGPNYLAHKARVSLLRRYLEQIELSKVAVLESDGGAGAS